MARGNMSNKKWKKFFNDMVETHKINVTEQHGYLRAEFEENGYYAVIGIMPSGKKLYYVGLPSAGQRTEYVADYDAMKAKEDAISQIQKEKRERDNEEELGHLYPGLILYYSWGYDQTNIDWYQVVDIRGKAIYIQKIEGKETITGFMSGYSMPVKNSFIGKPIRKIFGKNGLTMPYGCLIVWDGKSKYCSHYA